MRISPKNKVRRVADEDIILLQGRNAGDMTTVVALNETSLFLWNALNGRDFELADICGLLTDRYEVDEVTAMADAREWVATLKQNNLLES